MSFQESTTCTCTQKPSDTNNDTVLRVTAIISAIFAVTSVVMTAITLMIMERKPGSLFVPSAR